VILQSFQEQLTIVFFMFSHFLQEAHLSQRDHVTLLVNEYFAKSLKDIRNDTVE